MGRCHVCYRTVASVKASADLGYYRYTCHMCVTKAREMVALAWWLLRLIRL